MDSVFGQFTPPLQVEQQPPYWAVFSEEQSAAYIIRLVVSAAVLFVLTSEQIHLDPPGVQYRKAVMCCLMVVAGLVAASYLGYELRDLNLQHTSYKLAEAFWVLVNCTVFHFPAKILAEPQWKLNCFFYCSIILVLVAIFVHYFTSFNFAYLANLIVSAYTLVLLLRLTGALRRYGKPLKAAECLCRMECIILLLNVSIVILTAYARFMVYPIKNALFMMYWMRIHLVLVEYGREFVPEQKDNHREGGGVELHDWDTTAKSSWSNKVPGQLSSSAFIETVDA